jgi:hypothetical protein
MATTYNPRLPSQINPMVSDNLAFKFADKAADFTIRGTNLTYQLGVGDALMRVRRMAQREAGTNDIESKKYKDAFHRLLSERPKLAQVNNNLRMAALYCIEHFPRTKEIIDKLEKAEDPAIQMMGVRGLAARVKAEVESQLGAVDDGDYAELMDDPEPRRRRSPSAKERYDALTLKYNELAKKQNGMLHDLNMTGLQWRVDAGVKLKDPVLHRDWLRAETEEMKADADKAANTFKEADFIEHDGKPGDDREPF